MSKDGKDELIFFLMRMNTVLMDQVDALSHELEECHDIIDDQLLTIQELREQTNMNSHNSSMPPSSDGYKKASGAQDDGSEPDEDDKAKDDDQDDGVSKDDVSPKPQSLREKTGKKVGGQDGHPGSNLGFSDHPDVVVQHMPKKCDGCPNCELCKMLATIRERRQVVDIEMRTYITEHQALDVPKCLLDGCCKRGAFPEGVRARVQYGNDLAALAIALYTYGAVSYARTQDLLQSVFGISISQGTIHNMVHRCAKLFSGTLDTIKEALKKVPVLNVDETGVRVDKRLWWVHVARNEQYTYLHVHRKRGKEGSDSGGILPEYTGIMVHDCWSPYWKYDQAQHSVCCAHLLRELNGVETNHPEQEWVYHFRKVLTDMEDAKEAAQAEGRDHLTEEQLYMFLGRYDVYSKMGLQENPLPEPKGKKKRLKKSKARSLVERLIKYKGEVCLFALNFAVPWDNNGAERDIRGTKARQKIGGCFRTEEGAADYLDIMSCVTTGRNHGHCAYDVIRQALLGNPDFLLT